MNLVAPLYLAALAALALPWLLHRFNNASPEIQSFPSSRFLEPTPPPVSRRRRVRYWLLLALRVLALLALCLLFAEPWIERPSALAGARSLHVVAIDSSMSMRHGDRFERARAAARDAIAAIPADDSVRVLMFDREVTTLTPDAVSVADAADVLARLQPGFASADYGSVMQYIDTLADESELPVRAVLITDAQQSNLPERRNALFAPRLDGFKLIDTDDSGDNAWLSAEVSGEDGATVQVTVLAGSSGPVDAERVLVVNHDGRELTRRAVRLVSGEQRTVVFDDITLPDSSDPRLEVGFEQNDELPADDTQMLDISTLGRRAVGLAAPDGSAPRAARVFVTTALEADDVARVDDSGIATRQIPDDVPRVVVFAALDDEGKLPSALQRFVARGGGALLIDTTARADGEPASLDGEGVGWIDETHALGLGEIDWRATRFYALGAHVEQPGDRVLMASEDGRPILLERPSDNGLLLILNERLDGVDSNLPFQPSFVALMGRIVDWFDAGRAIPTRALVGDSVNLPMNVQVLDPEGQPLLGLTDTSTSTRLTLDQPGRHLVVTAIGEQPLSVRIDPRESDLSPIDVDERKAWEARHTTESAEAPAIRAVLEEHDGRENSLPLAPLLLPLLAMLLLAETLLANRRLDVRREGV